MLSEREAEEYVKRIDFVIFLIKADKGLKTKMHSLLHAFHVYRSKVIFKV